MRVQHPFPASLVSLAQDVARAWSDYAHGVNEAPAVFFGHSMGALVAYESQLILQGWASRFQASELMVAARHSPDSPVVMGSIAQAARASSENESASIEPIASEHLVHTLPTDQFRAVIRQLGGTPQEALDHPELWALLEPMLRNDIRLIEQWSYENQSPLTVPVTAWHGLDDRWVRRVDMQAWRGMSDAGFELQEIAGDHFFPIAPNNRDFPRVMLAAIQRVEDRSALQARTELFEPVLS